MNTVPLYVLIEAAAATPGEKHFTGNIKDFDAFTAPANLAKLDAAHAGAFAFLAFHPAADRAMAAYVAGQTVASDAGEKVLVLFIEQQAVVSDIAHAAALSAVEGMQTDVGEHPAYTLARWLFQGKSAPPLPGLVLFNHFCGDVSAVFVGLAGLDEDTVRERLREVFSMAAKASQVEPDAFAGKLGAALALRGITYVKSEHLSPSEWLARAWRLVRGKKYELLAFLASFIPRTS